MLLCELFDIKPGGDSMMGSLRQQVMDYLIPLVSREVDFVNIQDIEEALRSYRTGLTIDRGLIMQLLDPNKIKLVKKIEGDKVFLSVTAAADTASTVDDQEKAAEKINHKATAQAVKNIKKN